MVLLGASWARQGFQSSLVASPRHVSASPVGEPHPRGSRCQGAASVLQRSLRGALMGSFLKSKGPAVLTSITTKKMYRSRDMDGSDKEQAQAGG